MVTYSFAEFLDLMSALKKLLKDININVLSQVRKYVFIWFLKLSYELSTHVLTGRQVRSSDLQGLQERICFVCPAVHTIDFGIAERKESNFFEKIISVGQYSPLILDNQVTVTRPANVALDNFWAYVIQYLLCLF